MDKRTARFIGLALAESAKSTHSRVWIGSVIADKNYPVAQAANLSSSHPLQYKFNNRSGRDAPQHCLHSELHTIIRATKERSSLTGCDIFVARYNRRGAMAMCRPCPSCRLAIHEAGLKSATYTTPNGVITEEVNTSWL